MKSYANRDKTTPEILLSLYGGKGKRISSCNPIGALVGLLFDEDELALASSIRFRRFFKATDKKCGILHDLRLG